MLIPNPINLNVFENVHPSVFEDNKSHRRNAETRHKLNKYFPNGNEQIVTCFEAWLEKLKTDFSPSDHRIP